MKTHSDQALLREYGETRSEAAFAELVARHLDMVHSSALRIVRDPQLAEDVAQAVFLAAARDAALLARHPVVAGWLHRATHNLAANAVRKEARRRARELNAAALGGMNAASDPWDTLEPHIEEALGALRDGDRDLILLRFFGGKSARDIARQVGVAEATAQKRLNRAVDKLRQWLRSRGVSMGAASLGVSLSTRAVKAAPPGLSGLVSSVAAQALPHHAAFGLIAKGAAMNATHKTIVGLSVALAVGAGLCEVQREAGRNRQASEAAGALRKLGGQFEALQAEHASALLEIQSLRQRAGRLQMEAADLHRLRGEVTRLRAAQDFGRATTKTSLIDPSEAALISWLKKADAFKQARLRMPGNAIPELDLLTEMDWLDLAMKHEHVVDGTTSVEDSEASRELLRLARDNAKMKFGFLLSRALDRYREANNDILPSDILLLRPYFEDRDPHLGGSAELVTDAMLKRYEILQSGAFGDVPEEDVVILAEVAPADPGADSRLVIGKHWLAAAGNDHAAYWRD